MEKKKPQPGPETWNGRKIREFGFFCPIHLSATLGFGPDPRLVKVGQTQSNKCDLQDGCSKNTQTPKDKQLEQKLGNGPSNPVKPGQTSFQSAKVFPHSKTLRAISSSSEHAAASWTAVALHCFPSPQINPLVGKAKWEADDSIIQHFPALSRLGRATGLISRQKIKVAQAESRWLKVAQAVLKLFFMQKIKPDGGIRITILIKIMSGKEGPLRQTSGLQACRPLLSCLFFNLNRNI